MKRNLFVVFVTALLLTCCNDDHYFFPLEETCYQTDTIIIRDSVEYLSVYHTDSILARQIGESDEYEYCDSCITEDATAQFTVSLLIDNDESAELGGNTKVTIKDITIKVSDDSITCYYHPTPNGMFAEPSEFTGWHDLPIGISKQKCNLFLESNQELIKLPAGENPTVSIYFTYIVRTWDAKLADGYSEVYNYYSVNVPFGFPVSSGSIYIIPLRIALSSVQFEAGVSSYE